MKLDKNIVKNFVDFFKFTKTFTKKTAVIGLDTIKNAIGKRACSFRQGKREHPCV
jgi:hypothetical protein